VPDRAAISANWGARRPHERAFVRPFVGRPRRSRLTALGSALAMGMFGTTLSSLFSRPAARTRSTKGVPILSDVGANSS
jgi:hypothetical protein